MKNKYQVLITMLAMGMLISACSGYSGNENDILTASGTISAVSVNIAPEIGGKIASVNVEEGKSVKAGDVMFTIDSEYIQSQLDQANAAVETAQAALETAKVQNESAILQTKMAIQNSRFQFADALANEKQKAQPSTFELPVWYFTRNEEIASAGKVVDQTKAELVKKENRLQDILTDIVNSEFINLEKELIEAQNAYIINDAALENVTRATDNTKLKDAAQDAFDLSKTKLEDIQTRYDQALDTEAADKVLEARASVGAAQAAYDEAVNYLMSFYIGDDSLQVQAATTAAELAEKNVAQAEAGLVQAQASQRSIEIQLKKTSVKSPIAGEVLLQNLEIGELVGAGGVVMTVGNIDKVSLTVYIPEDKYGRVYLGQDVKVTVDSFPEMTYMGIVEYISDNAEFTPSNVQTVEGRKSTVFAIKITIKNDNHDLKPGMPADVEFLF